MKTIFVDVDTQFDFIMPEGKVHVSGANKLIPNFDKLMKLASDMKIKVLSCSRTNFEDDPLSDIFPPHCIKGLHGWEKIPETLLDDHYYLEGEVDTDNGISHFQQIVVEKKANTFFENKNIEEVVKYLNPNQAIVFGVATDYCVKEAALGLLKMGYQSYVVIDAVAAADTQAGLDALTEMKDAGVKFIKTEEVEKLLAESE